MDKISVGFLLLMLCGVFQLTYSTSCSPKTLNTCDETLHVKDECVDRVCTCVTGYTAVPTGCADPNAIPKPRVISGVTGDGVYSGEVFASEETNGTLDLFCHTEYFFASRGKFRWYVGDSETPEANHLNQVFVVEDITPTYLQTVSCRVVDGGLESPLSDGFVITGYDHNGTVSERPVVRGLPLLVLNSAIITTECVNIPKDPELTIEWKLPQEAATFEVNGNDENEVTSQCTIGIPGSGVRIENPSSEMEVAVVLGDATTLTVVLAEGSDDVMVSRGQHYTLTCRVEGEVGLPIGVPSFEWKVNTQVLEGQTNATVTVETSSAAVLTYQCIAHFPNDLEKTAIKKIHVEAENLVNSLAFPRPQIPLEGGHLNITCLISAKSKAGMTYTWHFGGSLIPGQTDNTLQMNAVIPASTAGEYTCVAHLGTATVTSMGRQIEIVSLVDASVTIGGRQTRYGLGTAYTFTCESTSASPGTSYEWYRGAAKVSTEPSYTYTATDRLTALRCRMRFGADLVESDVVDVVGSDLVSVSIEGPTKPVIGTPVTYTCKAVKGNSAADPSYQWLQDQVIIPAETLSTYHVKSVNVIGNAHEYGCIVKSGESELAAIPIDVQPQAKPVQPVITGPTVLQDTGHYKLYCVTDSHVPEARYEWTLTDSETGDLTTMISPGNYLELTNPKEEAQWGYQCKVTVDGKSSSLSPLKEMAYEEKKGKLCRVVEDCMTEGHWYYDYTGNCIDRICECMEGVPLTAYGCGTSPSSVLKASILTVVMAGCLSILATI